MKTVLFFIKHVIFICLLTVITQIGGVVYLVFILLHKKLKFASKLKSTILFIALYMLATFVIVPFTAPFFGREKVSHQHHIKASNFLTILLNRNYVKPALNNVLIATAKELQHTNIKIRYLDANFPFIDKFPLIPHLSHNDGEKIDLSFVYQTSSGKISTKQKSISGYGYFESPKATEFNQINNCLKKGYWQYTYAKYMTFGLINPDLEFSERATKKLINSLIKRKSVSKLFIEPHLKQRLQLSNNKIRYHGCRAVRHDDHIHLQIK